MRHEIELATGRVGRPSKIFGVATVDRIVAAIATGCTYEAASASGPISVRTFYGWMAQAERGHIMGVYDSPYAEFAARVEAASLEAERRITELWVATIPADWRAARDFLERRFPQRWRRPVTRSVEAIQEGGYQAHSGSASRTCSRQPARTSSPRPSDTRA
jgi:hypothetical protein